METKKQYSCENCALRKRAEKFGLAIVDVQQMIAILSPESRSL